VAGKNIRGSRLTGLGNSAADIERGVELAARRIITYWCPSDHVTKVVFSDDDGTILPDEWQCSRCPEVATKERGTATASGRRIDGPHKTPYEFMMMRRTAAEGEQLLEEALRKLHASRGRTSG
jgi:hypothetical protein